MTYQKRRKVDPYIHLYNKAHRLEGVSNMAKIPTTPNIETVRRISILCNAQYCYLLLTPEDSLIYIFTDIADTGLHHYKKELKAWCGMEFRVYNKSEKKSLLIKEIIEKGKKILPIKDIEIKKAEKNLGL